MQITYRIFKRYEPDALLPVSILLVLVPSLLVSFVYLHAPTLILAIAFTFSSYYTVLLAYVAVYRLSPYHPLARYPGPIENKLSKMTIAWETYRGKQYLYIKELHDRYRDIVRVGMSRFNLLPLLVRGCALMSRSK